MPRYDVDDTNSRYIEVLLNGSPLTGVFAVDTDEGWADTYVLVNGRPRVNFLSGRMAVNRVKGSFTLRHKMTKETYTDPPNPRTMCSCPASPEIMSH